MKLQFDKKHNVKPVQFKIGEQVQFLNYLNGKTLWLFGRIVSNKGLIYEIRSPQLGNRIVTRHANQIRTTMAQSGDETCSVPDDIIFAREEHGTGNETTDDQQTNTQPQQQAA
ncbi:hypothetical protein niasHT_031231 [Heterodera trifolii]|uniref:Uncharacterized protein n=1 Tax=Heterodera trifolii TaxID=157864 RepID=A0ABD2IA39_9BILA